jgi:hypothetical protein
MSYHRSRYARRRQRRGGDGPVGQRTFVALGSIAAILVSLIMMLRSCISGGTGPPPVNVADLFTQIAVERVADQLGSGCTVRHGTLVSSAVGDSVMGGYAVGAGVLDNLIDEHPECEIVVTFVGLPPAVNELDALTKKRRKFIVAGTYGDGIGRRNDASQLVEYLKARQIIGMIVPKQSISSALKEQPSFDDYFVFVDTAYIKSNKL